MKKLIISVIFSFLLAIFSIAVLGLSIRGFHGNPDESTFNNNDWKENGPLELSPERGRFALTYSVVENNSLKFTPSVARLALPDLAINKGEFVSLFAPGVSFLIIPGYILGKYFGASQVGSFAVVAFFALINLFLVRSISKILGAKEIAATVGGLIFLFATPAFAYAVTLYQHHISTFLILASIYILLKWQKSLLPVFGVAFLTAASLSIDYPNIILMAPIAIYSVLRFFKVTSLKSSFKIEFRILSLLTILGVILPMAFFFWFNKTSYDNPLQLAGTLARVKAIDQFGNPVPDQELVESLQKEKTASGFFKTRNMLNGFYIHFLSVDRGVIYYTPVVLLGILGIFVVYKKNRVITALLLSVIGVNILLYSMWGDPWGGWAFGSRYLIPSYALLSILAVISLENYRRKTLFTLIFLTLSIYSIFVNTLGAITTNKLPPEGEAKSLEQISGRQEKYSFARNIDILANNESKSYFYNYYGQNYLSATEYYLALSSVIVILISTLIIATRIAKESYE